MKWKKVFIISAFCLTAFLGFTSMGFAKTQHSVFIPSIEEIEENGYPVNENGETYGPYLGYGEEPDLIAACSSSFSGDEIRGYVKKVEPDEPKTLEEALAYKPKSKVDLYAEDGRTVIGEFR